MPPRPSIIAAIVHATLNDLAQADRELARRVRERMQPHLLDTLESTSRLGWLPIEVDVDLTDALFAVAGTYGAKRTLRSMMEKTASSPLLRPVMQTAARLHGNNLARMVGWAPKLWRVIYRDCGVLEVKDEGAFATLALHSLPTSISGSPVYLSGTCATVEAVFASVRVQAIARLEGPYPAKGEARIQMRWLSRAAAMTG